jgi:hypothetical protein
LPARLNPVTATRSLRRKARSASERAAASIDEAARCARVKALCPKSSVGGDKSLAPAGMTEEASEMVNSLGARRCHDYAE